MTRALTGTALVLSLTVVLAAGATTAAAGRGARPGPERCDGIQRGRPERCVGPVVDESGGGGDTLTIVVSVLVGLAVAGVAFVLLRRQLTRGTHD